MNTFLISDTHFGHENIIKYENRPFSSTKEMDAEIIRRWNQKVTNSDLVIHLGDFSLTNKEQTTAVFKKLRGIKWLVLGNHDRARSDSWWRDVGFKRVLPFPIIYQDFFILSHQPVYVNYAVPYINIHGHIHSKTYSDTQHINVSVEITNYEPVDFEDIKKGLGRLTSSSAD